MYGQVKRHSNISFDRWKCTHTFCCGTRFSNLKNLLVIHKMNSWWIIFSEIFFQYWLNYFLIFAVWAIKWKKMDWIFASFFDLNPIPITAKITRAQQITMHIHKPSALFERVFRKSTMIWYFQNSNVIGITTKKMFCFVFTKY